MNIAAKNSSVPGITGLRYGVEGVARMTGDHGQPHDALFRRFLGQPEHASSELRSVLDPAVAARIDLANLTRVPGTFVDERLSRHHTDVLFRTTIDGRRDAYVYVLMEHQRTPDPLMAFRMLSYQVQIWKRHLDDAAAHGRSPRLLPVIVPVVIYQGGRRKWNSPTDLADLLDIDSAFAGHLGGLLPHARYLLDDLTRVGDELMRARPLTPVARIVLVSLGKAPGDDDATTWLADWLPDLSALLDDPTRQQFVALLQYIGLVSDTPPERLVEFAARLGPEAEEAAMTTAEQLIERGRVEGLEKGRVEGQADLLLRMLGSRFGAVDEGVRDRIRDATVDDIDRWSDRLVRGASIEEIFA